MPPFDRGKAIARLSAADHWLCHSASFDVAVAVERLGVRMPARIDDTLFLLFLLDPYNTNSLKPSAERYLGLPPDEQDKVREWLIGNAIVAKGDKNWGAMISEAPASLVSLYAIGDVYRTRQLFDLLRPRVEGLGMGPAYEREVSLLPMLLDNEQQGIPIAKKRLLADLPTYEAALVRAERAIYRELDGSFDIGSGPQLADMLERAGYTLPMTAKGNRRTAKDALEDAIPDGKLKGWLLYHSALTQALGHYLRPWATMLQESGESVIHVHWNQTKGNSMRRATGGALTGRLSSEPNFQNLTTGNKRARLLERLDRMLGKPMPLPEIRSYVVAPKGYTLFGRDFSQQELKILADAEEGELQAAYIANPLLDVHAFVREEMHRVTGKWWHRDPTVKNVNFGKIYGLGVPGLSANLRITPNEAKEILEAHKRALPSVEALGKEIRKMGDRGEPIKTIGGRIYYAEKGTPVIDVDGAVVYYRSVAYRLLNYYVQGSAGDQTKQAMMNWWPHLKARPSVRFLLQVHDELVGMAPTKEVKRESKLLNECMVDAFTLSVPQRTTAEYGKNWGAMKDAT